MKDATVYERGDSAWMVTRETWMNLQPETYRERVGLGHEIAVTRAVVRSQALDIRVLSDYPKLKRKAFKSPIEPCIVCGEPKPNGVKCDCH